MEIVSATSEFTGDIHEMVDRCRSLQSRECWPGAVPGMSVGTRIIYGVAMRLQAATMTDIEIDEHVNAPEALGDGSFRIRTTQRVTWPDGHEDATTEYLFIRCSSPTATPNPARNSSSRRIGRSSTSVWSGWPSATLPT